MTVNIGTSEIRLTYTDEAVAPAPPKQLGDRYQKQANGTKSDPLASLGRALLGAAFGSPTAKQRAERRAKLLEENH